MDCTWGYGNNGCDGGEEFRSYQWIMKHGGIATEYSYGQYLAQVRVKSTILSTVAFQTGSVIAEQNNR